MGDRRRFGPSEGDGGGSGRFGAGQGLGFASRSRMPWWVRRMLARVLVVLLVIIAVVVVGKLVLNHFFPSEPERPASETGGGNYRENVLLSPNPYEAVRSVYDHIAQGQATGACNLMDENARQEFARNTKQTDCVAAAIALHSQVTNVNTYAESIRSNKSGSVPNGVIRISSCDYRINGGPSLGAFTVAPVELRQWLIIGHEPETCPTPTNSAKPSS